MVLSWIFGALTIIPILGVLFWILALLTNVASVIIWIVCMIKAYKGEKYKLPFFGALAEKYAK